MKDTANYIIIIIIIIIIIGKIYAQNTNNLIPSSLQCFIPHFTFS
jgi:hypothetical protein